jgi:hypothetical protein
MMPVTDRNQETYDQQPPQRSLQQPQPVPFTAKHAAEPPMIQSQMPAYPGQQNQSQHLMPHLRQKMEPHRDHDHDQHRYIQNKSFHSLSSFNAVLYFPSYTLDLTPSQGYSAGISIFYNNAPATLNSRGMCTLS